MKTGILSPSQMEPSTNAENVYYTLYGSQYGAKCIAALDAFGVPYRVVEVKIPSMKTMLAPPHTVPQMKWGDNDLLTDSSDIMQAIDRSCKNASLYPSEFADDVKKLEDWVGTTLNSYVLYMTWWREEGFIVSYEAKIFETFAITRILPRSLAYRVIGLLGLDIGRIRGSYRKKARKVLGEDLIRQGRDPDPDEDARVVKALIEEIRGLDSRFKSPEQKWICGTESVSAADFSLYGIIERLVGTEGDAMIGTAAPWLFEEANVPRLKQWHERMVIKYPIVFKGKTKECKVWK